MTQDVGRILGDSLPENSLYLEEYHGNIKKLFKKQLAHYRSHTGI